MEKKGVAHSIRHFSPAWFAVNMGTGAISILFSTFPYWSGSHVLLGLSTTVFSLNLVLFVVFCIATVARYWLSPSLWDAMLQHPVQSLFIGAFPMGAITLIVVATTVLHGEYGFGGLGFLYALWAIWWVNVAVSVLCCWGIIYVMITRQQHSLNEMSALWLFPVITLIVASGSGGNLAQALITHTTTGALTTLASAACMLSVGLGLACTVLVIYLYRLILHGFPSGSTGVLSACVPLGPMGQSGVAALLFGEAARTLIPVPDTRSPFLASAHMGECIYAFCVCAALAFWALATMWLGFALLGIQYNLRHSGGGVPPFQLAYWGLIFPNSVYAHLTIALAQVLNSPFFRAWGATYAVLTLMLWTVVFTRTALLVPNGRIFDAPCLQQQQQQQEEELDSPSSQSTATLEEGASVSVGDDLGREKTSASICC